MFHSACMGTTGSCVLAPLRSAWRPSHSCSAVLTPSCQLSFTACVRPPIRTPNSALQRTRCARRWLDSRREVEPADVVPPARAEDQHLEAALRFEKARLRLNAAWQTSGPVLEDRLLGVE